MGQEIAQGKKILLDKPLDYDFITKGIVFHAPRPLNEIQKSEDEDYVEASGFHATEHVVIEGSNMITGGVSQDLGGISLGTSGMIFIYDSAIGGNGASKRLVTCHCNNLKFFNKGIFWINIDSFYIIKVIIWMIFVIL